MLLAGATRALEGSHLIMLASMHMPMGSVLFSAQLWLATYWVEQRMHPSTAPTRPY